MVTNFAKNKRFPTFGETRGITGDNGKYTDEYFVYNLKKDEVGDWLNTWFQGVKIFGSDNKSYKNKIKNGEMQEFVIRDEMWTVKRTDQETSNHLYNRRINPISISILPSYKKDFKMGIDYQMKAQIHSIDDSSFGIWFDGKTLEELEKIRLNIMKWINAYDEINGEEFFKVCIDEGADEESKDYN
jgi:hypothetical protein